MVIEYYKKLVMYSGDSSEYTYYIGITAKNLNLKNFLYKNYIIYFFIAVVIGFQLGK